MLDVRAVQCKLLRRRGAEPLMKLEETAIGGAFLVTPEATVDARGFFARIWCAREFAQAGLDARLAQCSLSFNHRCGTLRGLHYQRAPYAEGKLVRCIRGRLWDVIVDLRETSPTFRQWRAVELSQENRLALFVPEGVAHGFQTLVDNTEVLYQMTEFFVSEASAGVRFDDPQLAIPWPIAHKIVSERDQALGFLPT